MRTTAKEPKSALQVALRYLSQKDRTEKEVIAYLENRGFAAGDIEETLATLRGRRYLDDRRVTELYVKDRIERSYWGPIRLRYDLHHRGVEDEIIESAMEKVMKERQEDERILARRAADQYLRTHPSITEEQKERRLASYLSRKGFSPEVVRPILWDE